MYAYARGNRSSRGIERACREDVTYKLITAMRTPDHSTIAEFRRRHEAAVGELFVEVLVLCQEAGLVSVGVIAIDGTKIKASASRDQNRSYHGIVAEILDEAERIDREEDELHGDARGDELPERFRSRESRRQALAEAKQRLDEKKAAGEREASAVSPNKRSSLILSGWESTQRAGAGGFAMGAVSWTSSANATRGRLPARAASGSPMPSAAWRSNSRSRSRRMRPMRPTGHAGSPVTGGRSASPQIRTRRHPPRRGL
jgi:hypothetical protein